MSSFVMTAATPASPSGESTLALTKTQIDSEIAFWAGYGISSANWTAAQTSLIALCRKSGERTFYRPPPLPGESVSHQWRFLRPTDDITTTADDGDYDLPDKFGSLIGELSYPSSTPYGTVHVTSVGRILSLRQTSVQTGRPAEAAIRLLTREDATTGARYEILLYPIPDGAYTLTYQYQVLTDALDGDGDYPLATMDQAECLLEACLGAAELKLNGVKGAHWDRFMQLLSSAVAADRVGEPDHYGYNADTGSQRTYSRTSRAGWVTVQGLDP